MDPSSTVPPARDPARPSRGWVRAAGLLGVTLTTAVAQPSVLMAVPFLAMVAVFGFRGVGSALLAVLSVLIVTTGMPGDGAWFIERAWAVMVAGFFVAVSLRRPGASFSSRALLALAGAGGVAAAVLGVRQGAWQTLDWTVRDRMTGGVETALEAMRILQGGEALPPTLVAALYEAVEAQTSVFPAMLGIATMAALGVAWWVYRRVTAGDDQALGPLRDFRFNDHLVWLFLGGLLLLVSRGSEALARAGANAVVFMGALYAVRGAGVLMFLSGGMSLFGYVLVGLGMIFVPPLVLTGAVVVGIGDTWLDVRTRMRDATT